MQGKSGFRVAGSLATQSGILHFALLDDVNTRFHDQLGADIDSLRKA